MKSRQANYKTKLKVFNKSINNSNSNSKYPKDRQMTQELLILNSYKELETFHNRM